MKVTITAQITVLASIRATDMKTKQELTTKEGKPLYELAIKSNEEKVIAGQTFSTPSIMKLKSEVPLELGDQTVTLIQFCMSKENSTKVEIFYRVVGLVSVATKKIA